jgi:hypothetical protein
MDAAKCGKMPGRKVSVSPASVSAPKRRAFSSEEIDLQCLICQDLAVDATQTMCCGALHCRSCISQCPSCPNCRKTLERDSIIPDVRCERLSAARVRMCSYAVDGCIFEGNRSSVAAHEQQCDFVPRSVLRGKIEALNAIISAKDEEIQKANKAAQRAVALVVEDELKPTLHEHKALILSALGPDPARSALRVLYGIVPTDVIFMVKREDALGSQTKTITFKLKEALREIPFSVRIVENNHNVALFLTATGRGLSLEDSEPKNKQGHCLKFTLLHPHDVREAKVASFDLMKLTVDKEDSVPNFMTSSQLDKYCANGFYYFSFKAKYPFPPQEAAAAP